MLKPGHIYLRAYEKQSWKMLILFSVSLFCTVLIVVANVRIWQTSRTSIELWWKTVISCVCVIFALIHWWVLNTIYYKHLKNSNTSLKLNALPCLFNLAWLHVMKSESVIISYNSFNFTFFICHVNRKLFMEVLSVDVSRCSLIRAAFTSEADVEKTAQGNLCH